MEGRGIYYVVKEERIERDRRHERIESGPWDSSCSGEWGEEEEPVKIKGNQTFTWGPAGGGAI